MVTIEYTAASTVVQGSLGKGSSSGGMDDEQSMGCNQESVCVGPKKKQNWHTLVVCLLGSILDPGRRLL